jgi:hypothetical protein
MAPSDRECTLRDEEIADYVSDGWRMRCPYGHSDLRDRAGPSVFCQTCREGYSYEDLVDARDSDAPVLVSPPEKRHL